MEKKNGSKWYVVPSESIYRDGPATILDPESLKDPPCGTIAEA